MKHPKIKFIGKKNKQLKILEAELCCSEEWCDYWEKEYIKLKLNNDYAEYYNLSIPLSWQEIGAA